MSTVERSAWRLDGHLARLEHPQLRAMVDALQPAAGMQISFGKSISICAILGVGLPASGLQSPASAPDFFVRGDDLVAIYEETAERPLRALIYWRLLEANDLVAGVELIVSVQTHLLDKDPALAVSSRLSTDEVRQLANVEGAQFDVVELADRGSLSLTPDGGYGCLTAALQAQSLLYAEMVHPADFQRTDVEFNGGMEQAVCWTHRLFPRHLEKGVILRSRIRGLFFAAETPPAAVAAAYREFAASPPPLTV